MTFANDVIPEDYDELVVLCLDLKSAFRSTEHQLEEIKKEKHELKVNHATVVGTIQEYSAELLFASAQIEDLNRQLDYLNSEYNYLKRSNR
jgi:chromosome segregation ATPase